MAIKGHNKKRPKNSNLVIRLEYLIAKMCAHNKCNHSSKEYQRRYPSLGHGPPADIPALEQHQETEGDHVPPLALVIKHDVEGPGHVTVAVVTAQVVHSMTVNL